MALNGSPERKYVKQINAKSRLVAGIQLNVTG